MKANAATYGVTILAVVVAALVRWLLRPFLGNEAPFSTFVIAVIFLAWKTELKFSLIGTFLGFLFAVFLFVHPISSVFESSVSSVSRFGMYFVICLAVAAFGEATRIAESRLRQAKELADQRADMLRITFASIGDAIITTDDRGKVTYLNSIAETLTGWRDEEARGQPIETVFRIVNEKTRKTVENPGVKALTKGTIVALANQTILISRDLAERPIDDSAAPIFNSDRTVVGSVLVFRDISERKLEQQRLADARSRLDSALAAGDIGTWEFDIANDLVHADANLARMFNVAAEEASGAPLEIFLKAIHPDDHARVAEAITLAIESDSKFESEYRIVAPGAAVRWVVARGRIERDSSGKAVRLPGVIVDVTQQKRVEVLLRASEEQRRQALDSAELGSWHVDPANMTLITDERFRAIFGVTSPQLTYEDAVALIHPDDQHRVREAVDAATKPDNPTSYAVDYRVVQSDGSYRWVFAKGRANFEHDGTSARMMSFDGTLADITEQKRMENELRQLAADLSEADHRKDEFLATLAHELRNPLAPIRNGLELMRLTEDAVTVRQARKMMERQLSQLVRLVDDLMDVSRISQGKFELRTERLTLDAVIHSAIETSQSLIDEMGHQLTVVIPEEPIFVKADLIRLSQVFMNLLNNAAKYTERGGHIRLTVGRAGSVVRVSVVDNGIGIAADQLPRIFDLFAQIDHSIEKSQGGLGIGLSLVKRLVEMHGGRIEANSEGTGQGCEFVVQLPVVSDSTVPQAPVSDEHLVPAAPLRILIVDDNRDGAETLAMMLKSLGNQIRTAYDGLAAVQAASEFRPDVILLDIGLPKLNGYEACRRIRAQSIGRDIIIIAQTGWGAEEDRLRTRDAGFDHHLVKPIDPAALMKMLSTISDAAVKQ